MMKYCYFDGQIRLFAKAKLPLNDLGLLRGYGVFDFAKIYNGKPFFWREHWRRFNNSAKLLGMKVPVSEVKAKRLVRELLKKNKTRDAGFKFFLTGGVGPNPMRATHPNFFILMEPRTNFSPEVFQLGTKVITYEHQREMSGAKSLNYLTAVRLQKEKERAGAIEILFISRGKVFECSTSNFFIIKNHKLITPKNDILLGTIRNLVIKLAKQAGIKVEEREVKVEELKTADEAFLTATNKDITPVVKIDNYKIGLPRAKSRGQVGPMTKKLMAILGNRKNY